jgi:predicted nucleic acid-binding protein
LPLIVDASVAAKWLIAEDGSAAARLLLERGEVIQAPDLVLAEVGNVLWRHVRRGAFPALGAAQALRRLGDYFGRLVPLDELAFRAVEIAVALDHPIYDCTYLALAERETLSLVTADARLLTRVRQSPWQTLVRPLDVT